MKKRIITGLAMLVILLPLLLVEVLFPILQVVVFGFCVIGTFEMIHMCEKKKKLSLPVKIVIAISKIL